MSADKPAGRVAGIAVVGMAVCCGLPVLLSLGAGVTIAGLGLGNWALAVAGLFALALAVVRIRQHRSRVASPPNDETEDTGHADRHQPL